MHRFLVVDSALCNAQIIVSDGPYITIVPVHPAFIPVPYYDPAIVFFAPEPGIVVGGVIRNT